MMNACVTRRIHGWVLGLVGLRRTGYICLFSDAFFGVLDCIAQL